MTNVVRKLQRVLGTAVIVGKCLMPGTSLLAQTDRAAREPDLGAHVYVFTPSMKTEEMQAIIDRVYAEQQHSEFGDGRYAFLFAPGKYKLDVPIGFYTEAAGLGSSPDSVEISGNVHVDAALKNNNATTTFWRSMENLSVTPNGGSMQWAVSQAVAFRRMHVHGDMALHQQRGWASGGWMSDTVVDGTVDSGSQQQWMARNSEWQRWTGSNWNMVFVGAVHAPEGQWPKPPFTKVATVPVLREKPFLQRSANGVWSVQVPAVVHDTVGASWRDGGSPVGRTVRLSQFYVAHPGKDTAQTINRALQQGKDLLLTPGTYPLDEPLRVTHKDAIVLGLGFATLRPTTGKEALTVADVDGVSVAGVLLDAGAVPSPALLRVGEPGRHTTHAADPIALFDVFARVGGEAAGSVDAAVVVNSDDTIIDHTWLWRADHGNGVGWALNRCNNGLIVNGDRVTAYGLFVEHHQQYQVLWNGDYGRTYFYQSEIPYDPPTQATWTNQQGGKGWASYKVADTVKHHEAYGLGVYSVFRHPDVVLDHAIEVPVTPGVQFHDMITVALDNLGAIEHVVDDKGESTQTKPRITPQVTSFP